MAHYGSQTLVAKAYTTILQSGIDEIYIVVPEEQDVVEAATRLTNRVLVHPTGKNRGLGSSIKYGITYVRETQPHTKAVLLALCDQPLIEAQGYRRLCDAYITSHQICASAYADTLGVPCVIPDRYLDALLRIEDHKGAKDFLYQNIEDVEAVSLPYAQYDIDDQNSMGALFSAQRYGHSIRGDWVG